MSRLKYAILLIMLISVASFAFYSSSTIPYRPKFSLGQALFEPKSEAALEGLQTLADNNNASIHKVTRRLEIYMISWEPDVDEEKYQKAVKTGDWQTRQKLHQSAEGEVYTMIRKLDQSNLVNWAQPNSYQYIYHTPNDTYFPDDGDHTPDSGPDQFDKSLINCPDAWDLEQGDPSVLIAIIDSGTDIDHPDLMANIWVNPGEDMDGDGEVYDLDDVDGLDNDGNGYIDDINGYDFVGGLTGEESSAPDQEDWNPDIHYDGDDGWGEPDPSVGNGEGGFPLLGIPADQGVSHGTHCSGIVAAVMDNEYMFAGVAGGGCKVMPVRVGNAEGTMTLGDVAAGIEYATIAGANVISMSLGGMSSEPEPAESVAIDFAFDNGVVLVAASGNSAGMPFPFGSDSVSYPASASKVIAVGSCDALGNKASFSQYGSMLDVVAPGGATGGMGTISETIWSTWVASVAESDEDPSVSPGDHVYYHAEGTSMACPQAAGLCGLILSRDPSLNNAEVRAVLRESAIDLPPVGFDIETGYGQIDAYQAMMSCDVNEENAKTPFALDIRISPNPFNARCIIQIESVEPLNEAKLYDINGNLVTEFIPDNVIAWDGTDYKGDQLESGIYLLKLATSQKVFTRNLILLK